MSDFLALNTQMKAYTYSTLDRNVVAQRGNTLYGASGATLYKSTDSGSTWSSALWTMPESATITIAHLTAAGTILVFGTNGKLYRSINDTIFTVVQTGISSPLVHQSVNSNGAVICYGEYATVTATPIRLYKSADDGLTWAVVLDLGGSGNGGINHFHTCQYLAVLDQWIATTGDGTINWYISYNQGATWSIMLTTTDQRRRTLGIVCRKQGELIWASDGASGHYGVFRSYRGGVDVNNKFSSNIDRLLTLPGTSYGLSGEGDALIVATMTTPSVNRKTANVYVSLDGGKTWTMEYSVPINPTELYSGIIRTVGPDYLGNYYFSVRYGLGLAPTVTVKMSTTIEKTMRSISEEPLHLLDVGKNIITKTLTLTNIASGAAGVLAYVPEPDSIETILQITCRIPAVAGSASGTHTFTVQYGSATPDTTALIISAPYNVLLGLHANSVTSGVTTLSDSGTVQQYLDALNAGRFKAVTATPIYLIYDNKTNVNRADTITFRMVIMQERIIVA